MKKTRLNYQEIKERREKFKEHERIKKEIEEFILNSPKCKDFLWKKEEMNCKFAWCKVLNANCRYKNCPKLNK